MRYDFFAARKNNAHARDHGVFFARQQAEHFFRLRRALRFAEDFPADRYDRIRADHRFSRVLLFRRDLFRFMPRKTFRRFFGQNFFAFFFAFRRVDFKFRNDFFQQFFSPRRRAGKHDISAVHKYSLFPPLFLRDTIPRRVTRFRAICEKPPARLRQAAFFRFID